VYKFSERSTGVKQEHKYICTYSTVKANRRNKGDQGDDNNKEEDGGSFGCRSLLQPGLQHDQ
jgi:hypothetical protein